MPEVTQKRSTLVLSAKGVLTKEQRNAIMEIARAELPVDVGVILLDSQVTLAAVIPVAE